MVTDLTEQQASEAVKITGSDSTGAETNYLGVDSDGRMPTKVAGKSYTTGLSIELLADKVGRPINSPYPGAPISAIRKTATIAAGVKSYFSYPISANIDYVISQLMAGGLAQGKITLAKHDASITTLLANGSFENNTEVAAWAAVSGAFTTVDSSNVQFTAGAASMRWVYTNSGTLHSRTQTFGSAQDFSLARYLTAQFFCDAPTGGAATRTVSLVLTSTLGGTRTYSIAAIPGAAALPTNAWTKLSFEIENPTSSTGAFDVHSIASITVQFQDTANKAGTVYWDAVQVEDQITELQNIYIPAVAFGNFNLPLSPPEVILGGASGATFYIIIQNLGAAAAEFSVLVNGILQS